MENNFANREIKKKIYKLYIDYPILNNKDVLKKLNEIIEDVKKQGKGEKNDRTK